MWEILLSSKFIQVKMLCEFELLFKTAGFNLWLYYFILKQVDFNHWLYYFLKINNYYSVSFCSLVGVILKEPVTGI